MNVENKRHKLEGEETNKGAMYETENENKYWDGTTGQLEWVEALDEDGCVSPNLLTYI